MSRPILLLVFEPAIGTRATGIIVNAGLSPKVVQAPDTLPDDPHSSIVLILRSGTDVIPFRAALKQQAAPVFIVSSANPDLETGWSHVHPDTMDPQLVLSLREHASPLNSSRSTVWTSKAMSNIFDTIQRIGPTRLPVLITGESGTGKEVVAKAVHAASKRSAHRMVVVDCAAIPPSLMESELFGHLKGAFTGASSSNTGLVRAADGGTFFLDEIGELPPAVQVKLLRLLQDGSFRPIGGTVRCHADLRIIAATNRNIDEEVASGQFRKDLYHRLNATHIHIPPLRNRREDIRPLLEGYLRRFCQAAERHTPTLSDEVSQVLYESAWPGNVRELVNCAQYLASLARGPVVEMSDLPAPLRDGERSGHQPTAQVSNTSAIRTDLPYMESKRKWLDIFEVHYVQALLTRNNGNISAAAREANMDRRSIQRILKRNPETD
jgi:DNA-binding NtrC family response regulator